MKRAFLASLAASFVFIVASSSVPPQAQECTKIKDGLITASDNTTVLTLGYDQFGYNYQARIFNGTYDSSDRLLDGKYWGTSVDYADDSLIMKWSDEWLSNQDCNGDNKLDRGGAAGADDNISMGWLTNQVEGDYLDVDSDSHHYTYFAKIVFDGGAACTALEPTCLWGVYTSIEEIYNDPDGGYHGVDRTRLARPAGFGFYTNK